MFLNLFYFVSSTTPCGRLNKDYDLHTHTNFSHSSYLRKIIISSHSCVLALQIDLFPKFILGDIFITMLN